MTDTVLLANPGADLYGSDRMLVETARAIVDSGRRAVVTVPAAGPLIPLLEDVGAEIEICPTPTLSKSLLSPAGITNLATTAVNSASPSWRLLRKLKPRHVIVNTITPPLWLPLATFAGARTICHIHEAEMSANPWLRRLLYAPLTFADRMIINSQFSLDVVRLAAPWLVERTSVVYNAVAGPDTVTAPRERIDGPLRVLYIGRLSQRKGPHVAIDAVSILAKRGVSVKLSLLGEVFPGNEAYRELLQDQIRTLGVEDNVEFLGFRPSIWPEVAARDVVVVPSTVDEPFGNTAVEASLAARPLVVSAIAGLKEAAQHAESVVAVPANDADSVADAFERIAGQWPSYARRAMNDAEVVAEKYSYEQYAEGIVKVVESAP